MFPGSDEHPVASSGDSSLHHILTDADILGQVCCYGAVSQSDTVARLSRLLLTRLLSQSIAPTEEACCSDIKRLLLRWIPYIEVHVHVHVGSIWTDLVLKPWISTGRGEGGTE